jgi:hypothetical protein
VARQGSQLSRRTRISVVRRGFVYTVNGCNESIDVCQRVSRIQSLLSGDTNNNRDDLYQAFLDEMEAKTPHDPHLAALTKMLIKKGVITGLEFYNEEVFGDYQLFPPQRTSREDSKRGSR